MPLTGVTVPVPGLATELLFLCVRAVSLCFALLPMVALENPHVPSLRPRM
jgi:hypothetical protein